jgi:hypothetical protein
VKDFVMLGFDRKHISAADQERDVALVAMKGAVKKARRHNDFVVYEATANDLVYAIFDIAKNDEGVHLEKAFGIIGSLGGFACGIVAAHKNHDAEKSTMDRTSYKPVRTRNGDTMYFGDYINGPLIEDEASFYRQIASRAALFGAKKPFDLNDVFAHHASQVGAPGFGRPRMPKGAKLDQMPIGYVVEFWSTLLPILDRYEDDYMGWPISFGAAGAQLIEMAKDTMPPKDALQIMMECAVPMSKISPSKLEYAMPFRAA